MGKDMSGLDEETKALLDQEIKGLNERVDSVQTITIKVEDRGLLSMELGVCAFGISIFAVALAWWAASPRTPLISIICLLLGLFGIGFLICGKRVVSRLTKRAKRKEISRVPDFFLPASDVLVLVSSIPSYRGIILCSSRIRKTGFGLISEKLTKPSGTSARTAGLQ